MLAADVDLSERAASLELRMPPVRDIRRFALDSRPATSGSRSSGVLVIVPVGPWDSVQRLFRGEHHRDPQTARHLAASSAMTRTRRREWRNR